jgi:hypothetical protein
MPTSALDVRDPDPVRCLGGEVPVEQAPGPDPVLARDRGAVRPPATNPVHRLVAHQPIDGAVRDRQAASAQQGGHLAPPIQALRGRSTVGRGADRDHRVEDDRVADRARRQHPSRGLPGPGRPRGDRHALLAQDPADRLDREAFASHGVDEPHDQRLRESSSPAKRIEAARRIEFASVRRLFSAFRRRISSVPAAGTPG